MADRLLIDLVTVAAYQIEGSQVIVPQRVDPEREPPEPPLVAPSPRVAKGWSAEGAEDFLAKIEEAPEDQRPMLRRLADWAIALEQSGLAKLWTYHGTAARWTLLPYVPGDSAGLVTLWNDHGAYLQFHRSVFERWAPTSLPRVEHIVSPTKVGKGTTTRTITDELLQALTAAYEEAGGARLAGWLGLARRPHWRHDERGAKRPQRPIPRHNTVVARDNPGGRKLPPIERVLTIPSPTAR